MMSLGLLIFSLFLLLTAGRNIPFSSQEISTRQHLPAGSHTKHDALDFGFHHVRYPKDRNHVRAWRSVIDKGVTRSPDF